MSSVVYCTVLRAIIGWILFHIIAAVDCQRSWAVHMTRWKDLHGHGEERKKKKKKDQKKDQKNPQRSQLSVPVKVGDAIYFKTHYQWVWPAENMKKWVCCVAHLTRLGIVRLKRLVRACSA